LKLFTVGPVACYPVVLKAMGGQMYSHRSAEYKKLHYDTVGRLQAYIETENPVYLFSSTGTGFMEAAVRNCVRDSMLACVNGDFGKRFADVGRSNGRKVEVLEPPVGEPITSSSLDDALKKAPQVEAVALTHNETSVGLINPLKELCEVAKKHGKLVFVDAVSSMGGTEVKVDEWGIDICFTSSQKCFGVPPGLAMASVSKRCLEISEKMPNRGYYFDFVLWQRDHERGQGTPVTSVIPQVAGLNAALRFVEEKGGKQWYFDLYKRRNAKIRRAVRRLGTPVFPKKGAESPTISCVRAPKVSNGPSVYEAMREKGFELAQGYGSLKDTTYRIGNMGYIPALSLSQMLDALKEVYEKLSA
jgi:aspartate aminotransferase-like enzyme